jgi:sugar/nucleoside kinase (ribokinase family)
MLDVVVRPVAPVAPTSDTPSQIRVGRGGSGANLAVALRAAAGDALEVVFAGVVGDDAPAQIVRRDLDASGVVAHVTTLAGPTGVVVSHVAANGERAMLTDRGVNTHLRLEHVVTVVDASLVHLHVSGYTVLDDATRDVAAHLLATASAMGATTSVDVCSLGPLLRVGVANFARAVADATMIFANEEEALALTREASVERALENLARRWGEVVITRGARGARARTGLVDVSAAACVDHVVDTTGAGDAATGTYLAQRLCGAEPAAALRAAMDAAANVVRGLGNRG